MTLSGILSETFQSHHKHEFLKMVRFTKLRNAGIIIEFSKFETRLY